MTKITDYAQLTTPVGADLMEVVDTSDTSMAPTGTNKKVALSDLKTFVKSGPTSVGSTPGAPATTVSLTLVMMGLGSSWALTPGSSGKVLVNVSGLVSTSTTAVSATYGGRFGTGTAPVNGAAVTGTRFGTANDIALLPVITANGGTPFSLTALLTLTPATAYWFDLALLTSNASNAAKVQFLGFTAVEIS